MTGTPKSRPGTSTPTGPSRSGTGAISKHKRKHRERKRQNDLDAVIDLTFDDEDGGETGLKRDVANFYEGLKEASAGPSRNREQLEDGEIQEEPKQATRPKSKKGKERAVETVEPSPALSASEPIQEPQESAFKPLSRSIMSGWKLSPSRSPSPPPHKRSRTESPSNVEIFIDEKPDPDVPSPVVRNGSPGHFEPPGLFSTALIPSKRARRTLRKEEKKLQEGLDKTEDGEDGEDTDAPLEKLLLPEHVFIEAATDGTSEEVDERRPVVSEEGLHVFDDSQAKGVTRYFDPQLGTDEASFLATADQSRICMNCKRPGHNQRDCPHTICPTCGKEDEHERRDCPYNLICFRCGLAGHKIQDCSKPRTKGGACDRCGAYDHTAVVCPSLWRMYSYYSERERSAVLSDVNLLTGWAKEAAGGDERDRHCYNCARPDHFGDDCPRSRGSLARYAPSAFNKLSLSLGPFSARSNAPIPPRPTHQRWDSADDRNTDKLPGQVTPFAGLNAGKKTVEKRKRAAMEQERQFGGSEPRKPRDRHRKDSDGTLPFGHRHFMSPAGSPAIPARGDRSGQDKDRGQIQFGKLSLPGLGTSTEENGTGTPRRNGGPSNSASTTLVNRALRQSHFNSPKTPKTPTVNLNGRISSPLTSTPDFKTSSNSSDSFNSPKPPKSQSMSKTKRRRRKSGESEIEEGEIEEIAFRKSGAGGGKVTEWGKEMDEEERKAKKVASAEKKKGKKSGSGAVGPGRIGGVGGSAGGGATGAAGGGGGLSIKGRSKAAPSTPGQRYHGGY